MLSNAMVVVTPPSGNDNCADLVIRNELHEVLELQPCVPKLHRLKGLLRGLEYDENAEDEEDDEDDEYANRKVGPFAEDPTMQAP
jgi:sister chromatid cohesion protein DCC1